MKLKSTAMTDAELFTCGIYLVGHFFLPYCMNGLKYRSTHQLVENMRLLTQHNQDGTEYSPNPFPHKRMGSEHKARSWNLAIPRVNQYNNNLVYIQNKANAFIKLCIIVHIFCCCFQLPSMVVNVEYQ